MKKFIIHLLAAAVLMMGLTVGCPGVMPVTETVLPAHIQRIENLVNEIDGPYLNIVDYRDTESTVWVWVDNYGQEGDCNFVVVLGVINKDTDEYVGLLGFNEQNSPDPCGSGYQAFADYEKQVEANRKEKGI
jgi:hypothetical protein